MVGFAVEAKCPYCRMFAFRIAVDPEAPVLLDHNCRSRTCGGRRMVFSIHRGHFAVLTDAVAAAMLEEVAAVRDTAGSPETAPTN